MHVPMEHFDYMITGNEQRRIYIESDDELSYSSIVVKAKASPMLLIHSLLITPHTKPHRECRPVITLLPHALPIHPCISSLPKKPSIYH